MEEKIFTRDQMSRIHKSTVNGVLRIWIDVHGMKAKDAILFIKNVIACHHREQCILEIVHGFNHGTAIKDTIRQQKLTNRSYLIETDDRNPGLTYLKVA